MYIALTFCSAALWRSHLSLKRLFTLEFVSGLCNWKCRWTNTSENCTLRIFLQLICNSIYSYHFAEASYWLQRDAHCLLPCTCSWAQPPPDIEEPSKTSHHYTARHQLPRAANVKTQRDREGKLSFWPGHKLSLLQNRENQKRTKESF